MESDEIQNSKKYSKAVVRIPNTNGVFIDGKKGEKIQIHWKNLIHMENFTANTIKPL